MKSIFLCIISFVMLNPDSPIYAKNIYGFQVKDIKGNSVNLSRYKGKPILVVNVASKCGYTPQYEGLEKLHQSMKDKGLVILGFPANNFGSQERGSNREIAEFCRLRYGVSFDMMRKISVKGQDIHPLYKYLTANASPKGDVQWNFEKFFIGKDGKIKGRFPSSVKPDDERLLSLIKKESQLSY